MKAAEAQIKFEKALDQIAYSQSLFSVFQDFLDFSLLMLKWWDLKPEHFVDLEKKYPEAKQQKLFIEAFLMLSEIANDDGSGFKDPFGDYFMEHFSNDHRGQFFTPESLCDMIAITQMKDKDIPDDAIINDPSCGSGRTLLSAAKINRKALFYGADLDMTCCKMTVINFMLNTMCGEIVWMDSLKNEPYKTWQLKKIMDGNGKYLPYFIEIENKINAKKAAQ